MNRSGLVLLTLCVSAIAQRPVVSPEVHADHRVTFRFRAPNAKEVVVDMEGGKRIPMHKDEQGVWSVTTDPLEPDYHSYSFVADGVSLSDPESRNSPQPALGGERGARARTGVAPVGDQ